MLALPRQRRKVKHKKDTDGEDGNDRNVKIRQKINDVFKFESPAEEEVDLKSFCKLLKKSCL